MNLYLMLFFSRKKKKKAKEILMIKIVKEHIGFHSLVLEIQLYTLILLELNIFLNWY